MSPTWEHIVKLAAKIDGQHREHERCEEALEESPRLARMVLDFQRQIVQTARAHGAPSLANEIDPRVPSPEH